MELSKFFHPSSIAVVGVSRDPKKVGHLTAKNLLEQGYQGDVYFINKNANEDILGKKVYRNILEIQQPVDLAVLAIPAVPALTYLDELQQVGVKNIVLFAAGFQESENDEGAQNEKTLRDKIQQYGLTVLGPNCIGFINTKDGINTTFLKHTAPPGTIGFISQSGALGSVLVDYFASHKHLGISYFMSLGNKTQVDESDILEFLANDSDTNVVGMYLEDIRNGNRFKKLVQTVGKEKPIVVLKSGSTETGSKAALSHTGGLIGDDKVYTTFFKQHGIIRAQSFTEFLDILKLYSFGRIPKSRNIFILSNAGGVGVLAADEAVRHNLILPPLSPVVQTTVVSGASTKKMTLHNPVDLLGDASAFDYQHALESLKQEKDIGAACVLLTPQANTEVDQTAFYIAKVQREVDFPIYPIFMGEYSVVKAHEFFEDNNIASFLTYDDLANCLSQTLWREQFVSRQHQEIHLGDVTIAIKSCEQEIRKIIQAGSYKPFLNLQDSTTILSMIAIPVVPLHLVSNENELQQKANELGYPLVMKIASDIITHKTEVRGVITAIKTYDELKTSYHEIVDTGKSRGVYLQPTAKGYEVFVGAKRDSHFGTVIVVGLGGIYAELLKDVSQRIYPFSREEYQEMIGETKLKKLFQGFRGSSPIDSQQLYSIVLHLGVFMEQFSAIKEIDINPLFVSSQQSVVADCRIIFV